MGISEIKRGKWGHGKEMDIILNRDKKGKNLETKHNKKKLGGEREKGKEKSRKRERKE